MGLLTRRTAKKQAQATTTDTPADATVSAAVVTTPPAEAPGKLRRTHSSGVDINGKQFEWLRGILIREKSKHSGIDEATVQAAVDEAAALQRTRGKKHSLDDTNMATGADLPLERVKDLSASIYAEEEEDDEDDCEGSKRRKKMAWTNTEDLTILAAVRRLGTQWPRIANHLPGRTADAVRNRWHRLQRIHALGDSEEGRSALDSLLVSSGIDPDWLPPVESECESSRRDSHLTEGSRGSSRDSAARTSEHSRSTWSPEEDRLIREGVRRHGCKWRQIAASLPNRSDSSVRNRWMRICKEQGGERASAEFGASGTLPLSAASSAVFEEDSEMSVAHGELSYLSTEALASDIENLGVGGLPLGRGSEQLADLDSLVDAVVGMLEEGDEEGSCGSCPTDGTALSPSPLELRDVKSGSACPSPRGTFMFPCPQCGARVGMACRP